MPISLGGNCGCDYCSDVCYDSAESAVSITQSVLGGVYPLVHNPTPS